MSSRSNSVAPVDPRRGFVWNVADGCQLKLNQITDKHLGNILRLLDRKALERGQGQYDHIEPFFILDEEAKRRDLFWRVLPGTGLWKCEFRIRVAGADKEDEIQCGNEATMFTALDEVGKTKQKDQKPYCDRHRPDARAFYKKPCDGCFAEMSERPVVIELGGKQYCEDCITEPKGVFWEYLAVFMAAIVWLTTFGTTVHPLQPDKVPDTVESPKSGQGARTKKKKHRK